MRGTLNKTETREWVVLENMGEQIFGILHRPVACTNPPLVVVLHGFASSKHGSNRCYVTLAEHLAEEGMACLRFDFRGSGDSGGTLSEITFEDLVSDAVAVLQQLNALEGVDIHNIALFGASLGGTIAILAAAHTKNVKGLALWAPVASGELWYRDYLKAHPELIHAEPGKVLSTYKGIVLHPQFREQFARMCAYKTLQQLRALPILHMHGEKDETVSIAHQEAFRHSCTSVKDQVKFVTFPDGEHALGYSSKFPEVMQESIQWFKKIL
jgi:uncharacterized protein